jgi:hypothetical protein
MNKPAPPLDLREWIDPPAAGDTPVAGYDAWLQADIAAGLDDIKSGKILSQSAIRKEFGLE